jgi:hypothetical protein
MDTMRLSPPGRRTVAGPPEFAAAAPRLLENGYRPVSILPGTQRPPMKVWLAFRLDDSSLAEYRHCGTGLSCGELLGLDLDVLNAEAADELQALAGVELATALPETVNHRKTLWRIEPQRRSASSRRDCSRLTVIAARSNCWRMVSNSSPSPRTVTIESYH